MQAERIVSVKHIGKQKTLDIEVNNNHHLFYGNGLATSNSHSIAYAKNSYWTAYAKAHWPLQFYASWLRGANWKGQDKYDEIRDLVNDAKVHGYEVKVPSMINACETVNVQDGFVYFGLSEMKDIGPASIIDFYDGIKEVETILGKTRKEFTWMDYLLYMTNKVRSNVTVALVDVGAFDYTKLSRQRLKYEFEFWQKLSKGEQSYLKNTQYIEQNKPKWANLLDALKDCKTEGCNDKNRVKIVETIISMLQTPPRDLADTIESISASEERILGTPITCFKVDGCIEAMEANATCKECLLGKSKDIVVAVEILDVIPKTTKKGKNPGQKMASLVVCDSSATLTDLVCFPQEWTTLTNVLYKGNTVLMRLEKTQTGSFCVKKGRQIS